MHRRNTKHYKKYKENARALVHARLAYFNAFYAFPLRRVAIKNSKSRWGSCSKLGNLNFNYKLLFLPIQVIDYVVVHELCHLKEFNHSPKFWALVAQEIPDYLARRKLLRRLERQVLEIKKPARRARRTWGTGSG